MLFHYFPTIKISIDNIDLEFFEPRNIVREKLKVGFEEFGQRDIYTNIHSTENYFFLNYDSHNLLSEIEVHHCDKIQVFDCFFDFNTELDTVAVEVSRYSPVTWKKNGEFFFEELKIYIMDADTAGGEGNKLSYFYCAADVSHLSE